jgi:DNA repair protein RecN (Recombination protein N)
MLHELRVENLLLMECAELRLVPGLNILTGETGAGKTLLAHALDLLLGGKARAGLVREGASEAYVEGVLSLPAAVIAGEDERIPADATELVLARRVWPDGRTRAYVCGRAARLSDLRELGGALVSFYGQHEHRKLMLAAAQLEALDAFCGEPQLERRHRVLALWRQVSELTARSEELSALAGARERELDLLAFELAEIEAVAPSEAEERELAQERERLRHLETLAGAAFSGAEALVPDEGDGVVARLAQAVTALERAGSFDPSLAVLAERTASLRYEADDLGAELRAYLDRLDGEPGRLESVDERLAAFSRLARKHGGTTADVLSHAQRCRERAAELEHADESLEVVESELERAREQLDTIAAELSEARRGAARRLESEVLSRLRELALAQARFEVEVRPRAEGCGPRGADSVEFRFAANPGLPVGPLREVASGGELSRVMLALLSVAHSSEGGGAHGRELLVFDEIDAGIGGQTARAVARHLRALSGGRQLLCITHLPQIAALADRHFTILKEASQQPGRTTVSALDGDDVVGELVRMLGADEADKAARGHARELLRAA